MNFSSYHTLTANKNSWRYDARMKLVKKWTVTTRPSLAVKLLTGVDTLGFFNSQKKGASDLLARKTKQPGTNQHLCLCCRTLLYVVSVKGRWNDT